MLKPRLWTSVPVFQRSTTRFAPVLSWPNWAENDSSLILVTAVMVVTTGVDELGVVIWSATTLAVLVITPGAPALVTIVIVAMPPLAIVPSRQVTVPSAFEHSLLGLTDIKVRSLGKGSVTITLVADDGPLLVMPMV